MSARGPYWRHSPQFKIQLCTGKLGRREALKTEAAKSRKQRRSLKQLHEDLLELGFEGSYDRVAAFARQWRKGQTEWVNSVRKRTETIVLQKICQKSKTARRGPFCLDLAEAVRFELTNGINRR